MDETKQATFEGWAVLEIFGHQRYAGYVTTQAFGQSVLFRVDVPPLHGGFLHLATGRNRLRGLHQVLWPRRDLRDDAV